MLTAIIYADISRAVYAIITDKGEATAPRCIVAAHPGEAATERKPDHIAKVIGARITVIARWVDTAGYQYLAKCNGGGTEKNNKGKEDSRFHDRKLKGEEF